MESSTNSQTTPADPGQINDQREVVEFQEDVSIQEASLPLPRLVSNEIISARENRFHDIRNIVTRTTKLETFSWDSTQDPNTDIKEYDFPTAITDISPNIKSKIAGFTYFRASIRVRILVNATRAQSGRLVAYFAPFSSSNEIGDRFALNDHLSGKTAFPHVFLNAGLGNVGELVIPYVSYYSHYEVPNQLGDMGKLYITVLNRLRSGEALPSCAVSVFAQFEDPQIELPTGLGMLTPALAETIPGRYGRAVAQVRDESEQKSSSRIISSTLGVLSDVASVATPIPLIGKFMIPVAWALSAASKIAHYAGFSKPLTKEGLCPLYQLPARGFTHADGLDQSVSLATSLENQIVNRRDVFGSDHDEMDIKFICAHECFVSSDQWSTSTANGAILMRFPVTPLLCSRAELESPIAEPTLLGYCASMFRQWRGSMKYKIQISKNVFHSGRLRVVFVPGAIQGTNPLTIDFNQCYSKIVDLVNADTIEFTIPFVANTLWKQVELAYMDGLFPPDTNFSTGMVYVEIVNGLRAPDIASDTIDLNLYLSSDDIEFSIPDFTQYLPADFITSPAPFVARKGRAIAQITGWDQDPGFDTMMKVSNPLFTASTGTLDVVANSVGEQVTNLRYLTRRFAPVLTYKLINNQTTIVKASSAYFGRVPTTASAVVCPTDYISYIFRFFRGSTRFKTVVFSDSQRATEGVLVAMSDVALFEQSLPTTIVQGNLVTNDFQNLLNSGSRFLHAQALQLNNFSEILMPYFSNTYVSLLRGLGASQTKFQDSHSNAYFRVDARDNSNVVLMKAGGDDFDMGWLVGPPRITPRSSTIVGITLDFSTAILTVNDVINRGYNIENLIPSILTLESGLHRIATNIDANFVTSASIADGEANAFQPENMIVAPDSQTIEIKHVLECGSRSGTLDIAATQLAVRALATVGFYFYL